MTPRLADTWYCVRCAREGKPYVYVSRTKDKCPSGHFSQSKPPKRKQQKQR